MNQCDPNCIVNWDGVQFYSDPKNGIFKIQHVTGDDSTDLPVKCRKEDHSITGIFTKVLSIIVSAGVMAEPIFINQVSSLNRMKTKFISNVTLD